MPPKKKVNRADYMFTQKTGETLTKIAPQIDGSIFQIRFLEDCTVNILDHSAQVSTKFAFNPVIV